MPYYNTDFPAVSASPVTPSDTVNLAKPARSLYIGTTGNVAVVFEDNTVVTFTSVPVGMLHVQAKRVNSTNTTASNIVAVF